MANNAKYLNGKFLTIRAAAKETGLPEFYLRRLEHEGKLPGFYSGVKKMVNMSKFWEMFNAESEACCK